MSSANAIQKIFADFGVSEEDFKKTLLKELNKEIDLPVLNEKKEGKLFKVIYDVLLKFISKKFLD